MARAALVTPPIESACNVNFTIPIPSGMIGQPSRLWYRRTHSPGVCTYVINPSCSGLAAERESGDVIDLGPAWCAGRRSGSCRSGCRTPAPCAKQPSPCVYYHFSPISALHSIEPDIGCDATVVCPPLTGRYATSDSPRLFCATSVAPAAGVTMLAKSLLSVVTPAISGCPALWVPSVNALNSRFVE